MNKYLNFIVFACFSLLSALSYGQSFSFRDNYPKFVELLGQNIKDPKFLAALKAGQCPRDQVEFEVNVEYPVSQLIPTQNEIDVDKSLKYPLQKEKPETLASYLTATSADSFAPGGPIVTAGGKYIIDGHHRWSALFLINPNAKIRAINMKVNDATDALKFTQMAIASVKQELPVAVVKGQNLLKMEEDKFAAWVRDNISKEAIETFGQANINGVDQIIQRIWGNALKMRSQNAPIEGAANRGLMPQTDNAPGWMEALQNCNVGIR